MHLITDPDICERWYLQRILHVSDRLLGCQHGQEQPLWKVCMEFEYVCKPVYCEHNLPVEATYIHETKLEERDLWLALQKSIFLCDYLAKSDGVFTEL